MIGVIPAAAFNRDWQREGILIGGFEKLFEFNTTALIPDEAFRVPHEERGRRVYRVVPTRRVKEVESAASARNGNYKEPI
jgi:hypothetical protein